MPGMDGFQVMEGLKVIETDGYLPVLVITAQPDHKLRALKAGAKDFISKPFDLAEVLIRVYNMLEIRLLHLQTKKLYDRVLAEQKVSEQQVRVFRSGPVAVSINTVADGRIIDVNEQHCKFFGYSREEIIGQSIMDTILWANPEDRAPVMQRLLKEGVIRGLEAKQRRRSGEVRDVLASLELIELAGENEPVLISMLIDITERKLAEETLSTSEARYRRLFEAARDGILILDAETGTVVDVNPFLVEMLGYSREQFLGKRIWELGFFKDIAANKSNFMELQQKEFIQYEHLPLETADGRLINVEFVSHVYLVDRNKVIQCNIRDITERKKAEEALRNGEEQFRLISENVADMIAVLNCDGKRIYNSPSYKPILGDPESLLGTDFFREIHPEDREKTKRIFEEIVTSGIGHRAEYRLLAKDGSIRFIESQGSVIRDDQGDVERIVVVSRDVSEKKQIEKQFLRAQRMESVGTLAGGIAHDLNNILAPIILALQVLRKTFPDERSRTLLNMLESSAKRGAALVRQILTFARGTEGERIQVHMRNPIEELEKFAQETFPSDIIIQTNVPKELFPINADPSQLDQVFLNLAVNARDAMPRGGTITISAENLTIDEHYAERHLEAKPGPYILVSVNDSGTGIPPEIQEKIFEPFFTTKQSGKGTGLGLSTVFAIVKNHGGFINLYSEVGRGTSFKLYFPAIVGEKNIEQQALYIESLKGHGECILLVDDEYTIREVSKLTLESDGYNALLAADGIEALRLFAQYRGKINLVIIDMNMPNMDGPTLIRKLRKMKPSLPIIGASGLADKAKLAQIADLNIKRFLTKPYTAETLMKAIGEMLHQK